MAEIHWDSIKNISANNIKWALTLLMVSHISLNEIFVKTKYNKKTLMLILTIVDSNFFLLVFNSRDFSDIIWFFILRFVIGSHLQVNYYTNCK